MDIRQLSYFIAIVDEGSFSGAAKKLNISQPPLSTQIQNLEYETGCTLFNRSTRHIELTDAGKLLYDRACTIVQMMTSVKTELEDIKSGSSGILRIGVVSSISNTIFVKWIAEFLKNNENIRLEIFEGNTYELIDKIHSNQLDTAFIRTPFSAPDLKTIYLDSEPMYAVGQKKYFCSENNEISIKHLKDLPIIIYRRWEKIINTVFSKNNITPNIVCISDSAQTTINFASAGIGIGIVPASGYEKGFLNNMEYRIISDKELISKIAIVIKKDTYISNSTIKFTQYVKNINNITN